jgi:hypothetical protein
MPDSNLYEPRRDAPLQFPLPADPKASVPNPWAADLKPWKPYVYRGLGFDIYNPDEEDGDAN